jgi:hypothetical protein
MTASSLAPGSPEHSRIMADIDTIAAEFKDGIQWHDLWNTIPRVMEIVETVESLDGEGKKTLCITLFDDLIGRIDLPGPDFLVKPALTAALPYVIDLVVKASNGAYAINA